MKILEHTFIQFNLTNFYVTNRRYSTLWGGSSLLNMFLGVIEENINKEWDYILNLSETDMPLLSIEELEYNLYMLVKFFNLNSLGISFCQKLQVPPPPSFLTHINFGIYGISFFFKKDY